MYVCVRENETKKQAELGRETKRQSMCDFGGGGGETDRHRQTDRQTETGRQRQRETDRDRYSDRIDRQSAGEEFVYGHEKI